MLLLVGRGQEQATAKVNNGVQPLPGPYLSKIVGQSQAVFIWLGIEEEGDCIGSCFFRFQVGLGVFLTAHIRANPAGVIKAEGVALRT